MLRIQKSPDSIFSLSVVFVILSFIPTINGALAAPPENGGYKTYYQNGQLASVANYVNGVRHGKAIEYHENGNIDVIENYVQGNLDGKFQSFYEDGTIMEELFYTNDLQQGIYKKFFPDGQVELEEVYLNDKKNGFSREYYKNGELMSESNFENGKRQGEELHFFENGQTQFKFEYENDVPQKQFVFDKAGKLIKEDNMKSRKKYLTEKNRGIKDKIKTTLPNPSQLADDINKSLNDLTLPLK